MKDSARKEFPPMESQVVHSAAGRHLMLFVAPMLILVGAVLSAWGYARNERLFAHSWLVGFSFAWSIMLGCLFLVALHHVVGAVWSVVVRRIAEVFSYPIWSLLLLVTPLILLANDLYPWMDAEYASHEPLVKAKAAYLNAPFFYIRMALFFFLWIAFAVFFVRRSLWQDENPNQVEATQRMRVIAGPFMAVFALSLTFASFDWLMSLQPTWYSTIYGVYIFSGMAVTGLSVLALATLAMRRKEMLSKDTITEDHLYNIGALLFAFSCFWGYIALSQFLLIWYGNLPEETFWFILRRKGGWFWWSMALMGLRFVLPFLALLSRPAKMSPVRLTWVSILLLVGQWVDLRWLIMPNALQDNANSFLLWELGPLAFCVGIVLLLAGRFISRHRMVAQGDPLLQQSIHFHLKI